MRTCEGASALMLTFHIIYRIHSAWAAEEYLQPSTAKFRLRNSAMKIHKLTLFHTHSLSNSLSLSHKHTLSVSHAESIHVCGDVQGEIPWRAGRRRYCTAHHGRAKQRCHSPPATNPPLCLLRRCTPLAPPAPPRHALSWISRAQLSTHAAVRNSQNSVPRYFSYIRTIDLTFENFYQQQR
jgi:hypothetical protein